MNRLISLFTAGCLVGNILVIPVNVSAEQKTKRKFVPDQIVIGFKTPEDREEGITELKKNVESRGLRSSVGTASNSVVVERVGDSTAILQFDFRTTRGSKPAGAGALRSMLDAAKSLRGDPRVKYAHPNWIMGIRRERIREPIYLKNWPRISRIRTRAAAPHLPNDPAFRKGMHWHYRPTPGGMNAVGAWQTIRDAKPIVVAVLDTGILPDHPDIKDSGNVVAGYDFVSVSSMEGDDEPGADADPTDPGDRCEIEGTSDSWHGTHVAGTVGAASTNNKRGIAGVSWSISVSPIRVLGRCGGTIADISAAIRWAAGLDVAGDAYGQLPNNDNKADVINLSLGIDGACTLPDYAALSDALTEARQAGVAIVVAAGNANTDLKHETPSGCSGVISVAASDGRGHLAPYSNFGNVSIMAPGGDLKRDDDGNGIADGVFSLVAVSEASPLGTAIHEGTSMAAPHVSAAIAIVLATNPRLRGKTDKLTELLRRSAAKLPNRACSKPCGPGLLDLKRLLDKSHLLAGK